MMIGGGTINISRKIKQLEAKEKELVREIEELELKLNDEKNNGTIECELSSKKRILTSTQINLEIAKHIVTKLLSEKTLE